MIQRRGIVKAGACSCATRIAKICREPGDWISIDDCWRGDRAVKRSAGRSIGCRSRVAF
jgi:hypothetical protein